MTADPARRRWLRWPLALALGVGCAALVVSGIVAVGTASRESLGPHERYQVAFTAIECPAPPGQDRLEFLGEVQYGGPFPDKVNVLDPALPDRLRAAFARHPRVVHVGRILVVAPGRIIVELTFGPRVAYHRRPSISAEEMPCVLS